MCVCVCTREYVRSHLRAIVRVRAAKVREMLVFGVCVSVGRREDTLSESWRKGESVDSEVRDKSDVRGMPGATRKKS